MGVVGRMNEIKNIEEIEVSYNCWMSIPIEDLENAELFKSGKVVRFWVKYCTLIMELEDGTTVEEYVFTGLNEDTKWPTQTMVMIDDEWTEYND
tara:strand:- start:425 stop:706 length:282 start_codon:yes stop_codon:yes gene_type:complete